MESRDPGTPGDLPPPGAGGRRLERPPSARYEAEVEPPAPVGARGSDSAVGPLLKAMLAAVLGAAMLVLVAGVFASTAGLLFVSGATGAAIGLLLAGAAVPGGESAAPLRRRTIVRLAIVIALAAVLAAMLGTWVLARSEGGVLGPLDYLWTTFGLFVPGELVVAAIGAAWGASAGPVQASR